MSKLLFVDTKGTGHHKNYAELVIEAAKEKYDKEIYFLSQYEMEDVKNIHLEFSNHNNIFFRAILRFFWVLNIFKITKKKEVSHIHFLYLDSNVIVSPLIYLILKIYLSKKVEFTGTLHHLPCGKFKVFFFKLLAKNLNKIVVHGEYIKKKLNNKGINNIINIEYPAVHNYFPGKSLARKSLKIDPNKNVLLSLGGTRKDKGLDILLEALNSVKSQKFLLMIAGKEEYFSKQFIFKKTNNYKEKMMTDLNFICDEKFSLYLEAADIIILPYRKSFLGQSGPLTEGVNHNCFIIASDHAQIGDTVKKNELGLVFDINDSQALANTINKVLKDDSIINKKIKSSRYKLYKRRITKKNFKNKYRNII